MIKWLITLLLLIACPVLAQNRIASGSTYHTIEPRNTMPYSLWTSCVFWATCDQDPSNNPVWTVQDFGSQSTKNNGTQTTSIWRPSFVSVQEVRNLNFVNTSTQFIEVVDANVFSATNLSFTLWMYIDSYNVGTGTKTLFAKGIQAVNNEYLCAFRDGSFATYSNRILFAVQEPSSASQVYYTSTMCPTGWTFIAITMAGVAFTTTNTISNIKIFTNGIEDNPIVIPTAVARANGTAPFRISGQQGLSSREWQGGLDDVRVYNSILTSNEIYSIYLSTKHP